MLQIKNKTLTSVRRKNNVLTYISISLLYINQWNNGKLE